MVAVTVKEDFIAQKALLLQSLVQQVGIVLQLDSVLHQEYAALVIIAKLVPTQPRPLTILQK